jgi:hypothetical protein
MAGGFYLVVAISFGLATGNIGRIKGSSFWMWFSIGTVLPLLGLIGVLLYRRDDEELRRQCPTCGRMCMLHDALCVGCGTELDFPDRAIESKAEALARR